MKTRKVAQCLLLQPPNRPLPSVTLDHHHHHLSTYLRSSPTTTRRHFTTNPPNFDPKEQPSIDSSPQSPPSFDASVARSDQLRRMISETFAKGRESPTNRPRSQRAPSPTTTAAAAGRSSADDLAAARDAKHLHALYTSESDLRASRQGSISSNMQFPTSNISSSSSTTNQYETVTNMIRPKAIETTLTPRMKRTVASRPSLGRTVEVGAAGVARALQILGRECRDNNVRGDQIRGRFHERKGAKRKRLRRVRWRRRFGEGFRGVVACVREMRRKGW